VHTKEKKHVKTVLPFRAQILATGKYIETYNLECHVLNQ
jgi:hypothetical protein